MSENQQHLWEIDHPYVCSEGNYYANAAAQAHQEYESWEDFLVEWGSMDDDLNLVFRWDWWREDPQDVAMELEEDPDYQPTGDVLQLYYMMQRKARNMSVYVKVTEADEPAVRAFLAPKAEVMRKLWEPYL